MQNGKVILFLQGPHSTFFARLANRLEQLGHTCLRINLSFSDWLFWRRSGAWNYRGNLKKWSAYLDEFYDRHGVTDIVLLGEQREHHRVAIELAKLRGIQISVTDWGYLRPDWLTFERDGMSGSTHFTKDPAEILRLGEEAPEPDFSLKYPESFARLGFCNVCGDVGNWLFGLLYPGYRSHLLDNPAVGYISTGLRMLRAKRRESSTRKTIREFVARAAEQPFFVFPLQMEGDFQIRAYSRYSDLYTAIYEVLDSFARGADASDKLVVKLHPWDTGLRPWRKISMALARKFGVASRVEFLDGGSLDELLSAAKGMVTINSTSGMGALRLGVPVRVLGECVYDVPGLTAQCPLDSFWRNPPAPDAALRDAFVRAMADCIQIKGGFFSQKGLDAAVAVAAERLSNGLINQPLRPVKPPVRTHEFGPLGEQAIATA
jgi:capsular polysaccharide export protein